MATIKSYTDLEQSKKLVDILPLESADMHYSKDFDGRWVVGLAKYASVKIPKYVGNVEERLLPCWSLAALLGVLPNENMLVKTTDGEYYCLAKDIMTKHYDNPVDVCVVMIEKLNELKLL